MEDSRPVSTPRPGWGARIRVFGYLLWWLLEGAYQGGQLLAFLLRRRRIRELYHARILAARPDVERELPENA